MRHVAGVWVPSALLQRIAADEWKVGARTHLICNGIAIAAYARGPDVPIPGFERRPGEAVIGTMAGLRKVKDLPRPVRAVATLPPHVRLAIVGEGPGRPGNADGKSAGEGTRV